MLELSAIFLGHLQRKRYDKLRRFDVFAGNLKSDHLKRIKRRVNDLQQHVLRLIFDAVEYIKQSNKNIDRFVTLSPKTDMAKRFHTKNGAIVFRDNPETVNYEYKEVLL